ncbi:MAG: hypothetical protein ABIK28_18955, partial [Planctomycetota bacterium]
MRIFLTLLSVLLSLIVFFNPLSAVAEPVRDHDIIPEDYFDIATINSCELSPDGQFAAYVESRWGQSKEGRKNDLWIVNLDAKIPLRLTFDGFGPGRPSWAPDSQWIYFSASDKRNNADKPPFDGSSQVWRIAPRGGNPFPVTRVEKGIRQFCLARDGKSLFYTTTQDVYEEEWKEMRKAYPDLEYGHG